MLSEPSGPGQEDWMTFTIRLEQADGTPAEPPAMESTVTNWRTGDTIPLSAKRTLQVVRIRETTPTRHPSWSSRTWPKERLAPSAGIP
jgi:hypothetical protein